MEEKKQFRVEIKFRKQEVSRSTSILLFLNAIAATGAFLYMSSYLLSGSKSSFVPAEEVVGETVNETDSNLIANLKKVVVQPSTHISHMYVVLDEILEDLEWNKLMCRPEDIRNLEKHKIPKSASKTHKNSEPRGTMVVYIAVGLLLTSLGAAFVELYKAKAQPATNSKIKPALTRRCSLADLTVLRHSRKEYMRSNSMYGGEQSSSGPLKLLDRRHSLLVRRCSFPVTPREFAYDPFGSRTGSRAGSRRTSFAESEMGSLAGPMEHRHYFKLVRRH